MLRMNVRPGSPEIDIHDETVRDNSANANSITEKTVNPHPDTLHWILSAVRVRSAFRSA